MLLNEALAKLLCAPPLAALGRSGGAALSCKMFGDRDIRRGANAHESTVAKRISAQFSSTPWQRASQSGAGGALSNGVTRVGAIRRRQRRRLAPNSLQAPAY